MINDLEIYRQKQLEYQNDLGMLIAIADRYGDTDFLQKLKAEIPAFLYFLQHRTLSTHKESRMWFSPKLTFTPALQRIIRNNRNKLELEMAELCLDIMEMNNVEEVSF